MFVLIISISTLAATRCVAIDADAIEEFKAHIRAEVAAIAVEFIEGNLEAQDRVDSRYVKNNKGSFTIIKQSQRQYSSKCQSNAFMLVQAADQISLPPSRDRPTISVSPSYGCGQVGDDVWQRSDANMVHLHSLSSLEVESGNLHATIGAHESKVWSIYFLGLPRLKPSSVRWQGNHMKAVTPNGDVVTAEIFQDASRGLVGRLFYSVGGTSPEKGEVKYGYHDATARQLGDRRLPDILEKRILSGPTDAYTAAHASWTVRIISLGGFMSEFSPDHFLAPIYESRLAVSNGVVFEVKGTRLVPQVTAEQYEQLKTSRHTVSRLVLAAIMVSTFALIATLFRRVHSNNRQQPNNRSQEES